MTPKSELKADKPKLPFKMSRVRWIVGIVAGILVGANAGVQLWQNLDLGDRLLWIEKPPAIEQQENTGYECQILECRNLGEAPPSVQF